VAGGTPRSIANGVFVEHPTWSPDGHLIAYDYDYFCYFPDLTGGFGGYSSYWFVVALTVVATGKQLDYSGCALGAQRVEPTFAPDGKTLIVSENNHNAQNKRDYQALTSLILPSKTDRSKVLTTYDKLHDYVHPALSPNGRLLAAVRKKPGQLHGTGNLWLLNGDATGGRELVAGVDQSRPAWSPDGTMLAFGKASVVYAIPAAGGQPTMVLRQASSPAWGR